MKKLPAVERTSFLLKWWNPKNITDTFKTPRNTNQKVIFWCEDIGQCWRSYDSQCTSYNICCAVWVFLALQQNAIAQNLLKIISHNSSYNIHRCRKKWIWFNYIWHSWHCYLHVGHDLGWRFNDYNTKRFIQILLLFYLLNFNYHKIASAHISMEKHNIMRCLIIKCSTYIMPHISHSNYLEMN